MHPNTLDPIFFFPDEVQIVELVAQHRPHLSRVLEMKELPLYCCDNGVVNGGDSCLSSFVEGMHGAMKVGGICFATCRSCRVGQRGFVWHLFFSHDDFTCIHRIKHGLRVDPSFDLVHGFQALKGSQAGDMVIIL